MGAAIALLVLLSTLGVAACVGDGFTTGGSTVTTSSGAAGPTLSASATGGAGGTPSASTTGGGGASAAGGAGGTPGTTASAAGGGGIATTSSSGSTETASSTVNCGCPVDAPTAGYPCCVAEGNACMYGQCADAGRVEATCKESRWLVKTTCATKCGPSGAPCAPGEICLSEGPAGMFLRSCEPDPCPGEELDCACAKPVLCPDQEDACSRVAADVIQCLQ
jgi:hypothetical protein